MVFSCQLGLKPVFLGTQHGVQKVPNDDRYNWNVLDQVYSCYYCLAINWQAPVCLPWGLLASLSIKSLVLISGCFIVLLLVVVLIT